MNTIEHMHFTEDIDIRTGKIVCRVVYHLSDKKEYDVSEAEDNKDAIKFELIRSLKKQMIEDLSKINEDAEQKEIDNA